MTGRTSIHPSDMPFCDRARLLAIFMCVTGTLFFSLTLYYFPSIAHQAYCPDFAAYYAAGHIMRISPAELYSAAAYMDFYHAQLPQCTSGQAYMGYIYSPVFAFLVLPLSFLSYPGAFLAWGLANFLFCLLLAWRLGKLGMLLSPSLAPLFRYCLFGLSVFCFVLITGQVSLLLALCLSEFLIGVRQIRAWRPAAALLVIFFIKPHFALPLVAYSLAQRQLRPLALMAGMGITACAVTALAVGPQAWFAYLYNLFGSVDNPYILSSFDHMINLRGMLLTFLPAYSHSIASIVMGIYMLFLLGCCLAPRLASEAQLTGFAVVITWGLLLSPWLHRHDLLLALPACLIITPILIRLHKKYWLLACYLLASQFATSSFLWSSLDWMVWSYRMILVVACGLAIYAYTNEKA